jgi:hypothetical protein
MPLTPHSFASGEIWLVERAATDGLLLPRYCLHCSIDLLSNESVGWSVLKGGPGEYVHLRCDCNWTTAIPLQDLVEEATIQRMKAVAAKVLEEEEARTQAYIVGFDLACRNSLSQLFGPKYRPYITFDVD